MGTKKYLLTFLRVPQVCFPRIFFKLQSHRRLSPRLLEAWSLGRPMGHYLLLGIEMFLSHADTLQDRGVASPDM
jgi:hypothetical protein